LRGIGEARWPENHNHNLWIGVPGALPTKSAIADSAIKASISAKSEIVGDPE
jgi:hypothetical protein